MMWRFLNSSTLSTVSKSVYSLCIWGASHFGKNLYMSFSATNACLLCDIYGKRNDDMTMSASHALVDHKDGIIILNRNRLPL